MKIIFVLITLVLIGQVNAFCTQPQRTFYMSYPAMSKRDSINNMFQEINTKLPVLENKFTDSQLQASFHITNLRPMAYYNDHYQQQSYVDKYQVNVTMGVLDIVSRPNFTISYSNSSKQGYIILRTSADPSFFTKNISIIQGFLQWMPDIVPPISISHQFHIEASSSSLTDSQRNVLLAMINDQAGNVKIRQSIQQQLNVFYVTQLKKHLNHEQIIGTTNITYTYNNITLNFQNYPKDIYLSNGKTKGLQIFFLFGLESSTQNCTQLPKQFDEDQYGGLQQIITFSTIRAMIKQAINKGLFDVTLDAKWQVPNFQFYMGDLGNSIHYANRLPAGDRFDIKCACNKDRLQKQLKISRFHEHQIYISLPQKCQIIYKQKTVVEMEMDIVMTVRIEAQQKSINTIVTSTGVFGADFTSKDLNFQIDSHYLAQYSITQVLKGLQGTSVFGSNFPALMRRYPVVRVFDDQIIIFDPSEN